MIGPVTAPLNDEVDKMDITRTHSTGNKKTFNLVNVCLSFL